MVEHYFVSYSSADGKDFCAQLASGLRSASPPVEPWIDKERLRPGIDWDEQLVEAIRNCKGLLFIMTRDSVHPKSVCKSEWFRAMKYKKPVIPLYFHDDIEIPLRLDTREYIDFTMPFETALGRLCEHLNWLDTPEGVLSILKSQLLDLERELPRAEASRQPGIETTIQELKKRIEEQQALVDDPQGASQRTEQRIIRGLKRIQTSEPRETAQPVARFINPPPTVAPTWFQDRHVETGLVADFIRDEALRMMIVLGRAGIGKTTMVCRLLRSLEAGRLPDDGSPLSVDGIVYLSPRGTRQVNFSDMFADLCSFLPENTAHMLQAMHQDAQTNITEEMRALLANFQSKCIVVLLDNFEDIVDTETGELQDSELDAALRALLELPEHGIKVIITTRVAPRSLQMAGVGRQTLLELDKGLDSPYAENILRAMDRDGKVGLRDASTDILKLARERTRGYPRALEALFAILSADRDTSLDEILNEASGLLPDKVVEVLVGEAFSRLDPLAQKVMQALAIYSSPVPPTAIDYLLHPYEPGIDSAPVLKRLVNMQFARREYGQYYLHHVDRSYALERIPEGQPKDWQGDEQASFTRCGLRHRGAEYFHKVRRDESTWVSIEDIKPLFAEFDLLAASGDFEGALTVLYTAIVILEREGFYRQIERMADVLIQQSKVEATVRAHAMGLAGWALSSLGENEKAVQLLSEALKLPDLDPYQANSWRLEIANCYGIIGDQQAAADTYRAILGNSSGDISMQTTAQLGLGWLAEIQNLHNEAENIYKEALKSYLHEFTLEMTAENTFTFNPDVLPPEAPFMDPLAWYPIGEFAPEGSTDPAEDWFLYGVQIEPFSDEIPDPGQIAEIEEDEDEVSVLLALVVVTYELARIWERIAAFFERIDHFVDAYASCRLALSLYDILEEDTGIAAMLEAMRRMAPQFSDDEAQELIEEQERELERARASRHRKLEITIMQNLAQSYLESNRVEEAKVLYLELLRHGKELEFSYLVRRAEYGLARVDWANDDLNEAVERLLNLLDQSALDLPLFTETLALLSRIEFARGNRVAANQYAQQASQGFVLLKSPFQVLEMEQLLASIAIEDREYDLAVERLELASRQAQELGIPSVTASVLSDLAYAYLSAGLEEQSLRVANDAYSIASEIKLSSYAAEMLMTVARIAAELRKFDLSKDSYQQALHTYESVGNTLGQINVYRGLSWMYYLEDTPEEQLQAARTAWEMAKEYSDPSFARNVRMELANALGDNELYEEAIRHYEAILAEAPSDALFRGNYGWILFQAGEYDSSLKESQRALELDETQTIAIRNLGHAYLAKGLPDEAEREYRRAIRERKGGEHFIETIRVIKKLLAEKPGLPRGEELLTLIEEEQKRLDAEKEVQSE